MLPPPLQARKDIWKEVHEVHKCSKLTSEMLKEAIRFNFITVGNQTSWPQTFCIPGWQLCRTCYDISQKIEKNVGNEMSQSEHESP